MLEYTEEIENAVSDEITVTVDNLNIKIENKTLGDSISLGHNEFAQVLNIVKRFGSALTAINGDTSSSG